jgi:hypothetical protein
MHLRADWHMAWVRAFWRRLGKDIRLRPVPALVFQAEHSFLYITCNSTNSTYDSVLICVTTSLSELYTTSAASVYQSGVHSVAALALLEGPCLRELH